MLAVDSAHHRHGHAHPQPQPQRRGTAQDKHTHRDKVQKKVQLHVHHHQHHHHPLQIQKELDSDLSYLKLELPRIEPVIVPPLEVVDLVRRVDVARIPELVEDGCGTVYKLHDATGKELAIFKPFERENPRAPFNEIAAYLLDQGEAGVPATGLVNLPIVKGEPRLGSIQQFLGESESAADLGTGLFATEDVHKIGVLDIRIMNCDRHSGNMLYCKETKRLLPIDHGLCFPSASSELGNASFDWLLFPQSKEPFSSESLKMIESIDIASDLGVLQKLGMKEDALLTVLMSTTMLKLGARLGKSLYEIGSLVQRQGDRSRPSVLEILFSRTCDMFQDSDLSCSWSNFEQVFAQLVWSYQMCM